MTFYSAIGLRVTSELRAALLPACVHLKFSALGAIAAETHAIALPTPGRPAGN
jgi:hypothetical protein